MLHGRGSKEGKPHFYEFLGFFTLLSVVVERNLLQVPNIFWATGPNESPIPAPGRAQLRCAEAWRAPQLHSSGVPASLHGHHGQTLVPSRVFHEGWFAPFLET